MKRYWQTAALAVLTLVIAPVFAEANVPAGASQLRDYKANKGGRLAVGQRDVLIQAHGECRWLDNDGVGSEYFVPLATQIEWQSFIDNAPSTITRALCCPSKNVRLRASDGQQKSATLGIGRDNGANLDLSQKLVTHSFNVTRPADGATWTETVSELYLCQGGDWVGQGAETTSTTPELVPPATPLTFTCQTNAGWRQGLTVRDANGRALFDHDFGNGEPGPKQTLTVSLARAAVSWDSFNSRFPGQRGENAIRTTPRVRQQVGDQTCFEQSWDAEDGADYDYNDLMCTVKWCAAASVALSPIDGECGAAHGKLVNARPSSPSDLCNMGSPTLPTRSGDKFVWQCGGINEGRSTSCSATGNFGSYVQVGIFNIRTYPACDGSEGSECLPKGSRCENMVDQYRYARLRCQ